MSLDMLSRLKGIETTSQNLEFAAIRPSLDMLSRLKGIETPTIQQKSTLSVALDMLSRLKGIETLTTVVFQGVRLPPFGYAFPFEGN